RQTFFLMIQPRACGPCLCGTQSLENGSQRRGYNVLLAPRLTDQRFPAKLEMLIFSNVTSAGRESAYATALATSPGEIILWRGHFPSICVQMLVSVAAGQTL